MHHAQKRDTRCDIKKTKTDKRVVSSSEISFSEILYREHFNKKTNTCTFIKNTRLFIEL
jgi:hypothetical protein